MATLLEVDAPEWIAKEPLVTPAVPGMNPQAAPLQVPQVVAPDPVVPLPNCLQMPPAPIPRPGGLVSAAFRSKCAGRISRPQPSCHSKCHRPSRRIAYQCTYMPHQMQPTYFQQQIPLATATIPHIIPAFVVQKKQQQQEAPMVVAGMPPVPSASSGSPAQHCSPTGSQDTWKTVTPRAGRGHGRPAGEEEAADS
jgi:hypothetical protein